MATGFLTPDARLRVFSDTGTILPGGKLNTYAAGTTTPLASYSDVALTVANANPVVASAGGLFGPIYLTPGSSYKIVLTDAAGVAVWTQDNVAVPVLNALASGTGISLATAAGVTTITATVPTVASISANNFRLSLTSGVPVTTADVLAGTTIYCTPYLGNRIDLYDVTGVPTSLVSAQFSIAVPATTSQMYDIFAYNNAGVATLELLAWTNDTTRATALVLTTTGTYTKSGDLTRRYLGSFRTTTVAGQTEDSQVKRFLWNYYNRKPRAVKVVEATASWTYSLVPYHQVNASAANQIAVVVGVAEDPVSLMAVASATNNSGVATFLNTAIGYDSTTAFAPGMIAVGLSTAFSANGIAANPVASLTHYPAVGFHFYAWLEAGASLTTTWYGTNGGTLFQTGMTGMSQG